MKVRPWVVALAVAALGVVVFAPSLAGGWIWDDHPLIEDNPYVHAFHGGRWLTTDFSNIGEHATRLLYWRPGVQASYALDWTLGGGAPPLFHVSNLVYHGAVCALAFVTLRRWIGSDLRAVAAAAVLFAVHPTKAESVAWIAGRTDVLCMLGLLLATHGMAKRSRALEIAGTAIAYLCKEQAIVLPVFAFVEAWVAGGRAPLDRPILARCARAAVPQAAVAAMYLVTRQIWMPIGFINAGDLSLPLGDHVLVVLDSLGRMFELTFAPHALSAQEGLIVNDGAAMVHSMPHVALGAIALVALAAAAVVARKRFPAATIGIAFYLLTLLPTANLKFTAMTALVSDRYLYVPVLGLAFVAGAAVASQRRLVPLAAACGLALAMLSANRAADFSDEHAFWARELRLHPDSREALQYQYRAAAREKHYDVALGKLLELERLQGRVAMPGGDVAIATDVATILAQLVPDHDAPSLRAIDAFAAALLAHDQPAARLDVRGVALAVPTVTPSFGKNLQLAQARLYNLRAELASRLGDDATAVKLAESARAACATCVDVVAGTALAYARAGRYTDARESLAAARGKVSDAAIADMTQRLARAEVANRAALEQSGPPQLQAHAQELAMLGLYGRAYDVLAPYKADIAPVPAIALTFAELAFRAGEPAVAREVLAGRGDADALLATWAAKMGWTTSGSGPSSL